MITKRRRHPLVGKSTILPFPIAVVCWMDLLGYGAMIADSEFNPLHPKAAQAMQRLRRFHAIVASNSARHFPTLVMNDGAASYRDLSLRSRSPSHDFLVRAWNLFLAINHDERKHGLPGARVVLATGFRMRGRRDGRDAIANQLKSIMNRFQNREISSEQAIREAAHIRQAFDIIPQLQANFAFSKAYVAESSGTAGGLSGARFFVDLALFDNPTPAWIVLGETIEWSNETLRMRASLAPILDIPPRKYEEGGPLGIRDGLEVAQCLTQDPNVLTALRAARSPST
jgi:hypothetical protein